jgi:hypothetical protein
MILPEVWVDEVGRTFCKAHRRSTCNKCCMSFDEMNERAEIAKGLRPQRSAREELLRDKAMLERGLKALLDMNTDDNEMIRDNLKFHERELKRVNRELKATSTEAKPSPVDALETRLDEAEHKVLAANVRLQSLHYQWCRFLLYLAFGLCLLSIQQLRKDFLVYGTVDTQVTKWSSLSIPLPRNLVACSHDIDTWNQYASKDESREVVPTWDKMHFLLSSAPDFFISLLSCVISFSLLFFLRSSVQEYRKYCSTTKGASRRAATVMISASSFATHPAFLLSTTCLAPTLALFSRQHYQLKMMMKRLNGTLVASGDTSFQYDMSYPCVDHLLLPAKLSSETSGLLDPSAASSGYKRETVVPVSFIFHIIVLVCYWFMSIQQQQQINTMKQVKEAREEWQQRHHEKESAASTAGAGTKSANKKSTKNKKKNKRA